MTSVNSEIMFTVIIPARNAADYIGATLHSLRLQSLGGFATYIIDDGSTDETANIVQMFIAGNNTSRFSLHKGTAEGVSKARNIGLAMAKTPYVLFLDADDLLAVDALERFASALNDTDNVAALGQILRIDQDGTPLVSHDNRDLVPDEDQLAALIRKNYIVNGGAFAIRTDVAQSSGGYAEGLRFGEDWEFWCRILLAGQVTLVQGEPVLNYRQIATGANNMAKGSVFARNIPSLDLISQNLDIQQRFGSSLRKMIRARRIDVFWSGVRTRFQYDTKISAMMIALLGMFVYPDSVTRPGLALRFLKSLRG